MKWKPIFFYFELHINEPYQFCQRVHFHFHKTTLKINFPHTHNSPHRILCTRRRNVDLLLFYSVIQFCLLLLDWRGLLAAPKVGHNIICVCVHFDVCAFLIQTIVLFFFVENVEIKKNRIKECVYIYWVGRKGWMGREGRTFMLR